MFILDCCPSRHALFALGFYHLVAATAILLTDLSLWLTLALLLTLLLLGRRRIMPELDGFSVLETLQQQGSKVPVIVLSADIQDSIRQKCLDLGAVTMLKKPPSSSQILEAIDRALQN